MPRREGDKYFFNVSRGLITEASKVAFPEDAATDLDNINVDIDGVASRRSGIDYEASGTSSFTYSAGAGRSVITSYMWSSNGSYYPEDIFVIAIGSSLYFFDTSQEPVSSGYIGTVSISGARARDTMQMADGQGKLYVVSRFAEPHVIEIDDDDGSLSSYSITLKVRDKRGVNGGYDERASTLTNAVRYNLLNGGWPEVAVSWGDRIAPGVTIPRSSLAWEAYYSERGEYPGTQDNFADYADGNEMTPRVASLNLTSGIAPKGRVILDAFNQDRSSYKGFSTGLTDDDGEPTISVTDERPRAVAYYQGHVVYAGCSGNDYGNSLLISQTVLNKEGEKLCYQVNDPTAQEENSPLATDGGVITIEGMVNVKALKSFGGSLLIFSTNGLWSLSPGSEGLFQTSDFSVRKLHSAGIVSEHSIIESGDAVMYWSEEGIILVTLDDTLADIKASNITDQTIKTFYDNIGAVAQTFVQAVVDKIEKKAYWFYPSVASTTEEWPAKLNKALVMDLRTGGFYKWSIGNSETSPFIIGGFSKPGRSISVSSDDVIVGADTVVVGADTVIVSTESAVAGEKSSKTKFATFVPNGANWDFRFSEETNADLIDWETWDSTGIDYTSYLETGYFSGGEPMYDKQVEMVQFYFERTETAFVDNGSGGVAFDFPSSCLMRAKWDWTTSADFNRWSDQQQIYRFLRPYIPGAIGDSFDYDQDVIFTRVRVRGRGKSFLMRLESETGKDFRLIGWGIKASSGSRP